MPKRVVAMHLFHFHRLGWEANARLQKLFKARIHPQAENRAVPAVENGAEATEAEENNMIFDDFPRVQVGRREMNGDCWWGYCFWCFHCWVVATFLEFIVEAVILIDKAESGRKLPGNRVGRIPRMFLDSQV